MGYLRKAIQVLLFAVFTFGGLDRLVQPIDVLAERMLWVSYFDPSVVRAIALTEITCGIGLILPFLFKKLQFKFVLYSGSILIITMIGAAVTHLVIGDYDQIIVNLVLVAIIAFITFPRKPIVQG